jgi:hypothetical protein
MSIENNINKQKQFNEEKRKSITLNQEEEDNLQGIFNLLQANLNELAKGNDSRNQAVGAARKLRSITQDLLNDAQETTDLDLKTLNKKKELAAVEQSRLERMIATGDITGDELNNLKSILEETERINSAIDERIEKEKNIQKSMGVQSSLVEGISGGLKKGGFGSLVDSLGIDDALKGTREYTKNLTQGGKKAAGIGGKFKIAGNLAKNLGKNLSKALGPVALIAELIQGIGRADKQITELGKSMALTKGEAEDIFSAMGGAAAASGNLNVTTEKLAKNFSALNEQLGFVNNFTMSSLVTMTKLTEQVGLGAKEAGSLVTLSEARGQNAESEYKATLAATYELQRQSGIQIDNRKILEAVANTTGQIRANLGANPTEIAKAVTLAKQLGGTLDDVKTISSSLLDFESSIAAELEAELLTGKEINVEKARLAALNGDIVTLEKEIASQIGTFTEFSKMSVIQQEALAKSFGLSSDKMADMLFNQQVMGRSAKELRALGEEELAQRVEQQTMADKFNQTIEKLKGIFTDVGGALVPLIDLLGFALSIVGAIAALIMDIVRMLKGDFSFSGITGAVESLGTQLGFDTSGGSEPTIMNERPGQSLSSGNNPSNTQAMKQTALLEQLLAKDTSISMDGRKLNNAVGTSAGAYNIGN